MSRDHGETPSQKKKKLLLVPTSLDVLMVHHRMHVPDCSPLLFPNQLFLWEVSLCVIILQGQVALGISSNHQELEEARKAPL